MARSDNAATIAAVAAKVKTVGQARLVLGNVANLLGAAYAKTADASLWDEAELKDSINGRLNTVNNGAQRLYATLPIDDGAQSAIIDATTAAKLGLLIAQAQEACKDVESAIHENAFDIAGTLVEGVENAAGYAGSAANAVAKGAVGGTFAFVRAAWLAILVAVVALLVYLFWPRILRRFAR